MSKIKPGVKARIIQGALGPKGPNVGKIVTVVHADGEHTLHGPIWKVQSAGENLVTELGVICDNLHCAEDWLDVIDDDQLKTNTEEKKELTV
ncbi:hypothetical protein [Ralstonia phage RP13]|nr:hypothetical protein [Ralstonia phage RP13]